MMKRFYFLLLACLALVSIEAQNVQLHYDFGSKMGDAHKGRPSLTTTIEQFRPDKWGNTFYFVDMDYQDSGIRSAYWEISRELRFWRAPLLLHLEYNGGLSNQFSYKDAYLFGATYAYHNKDYTFGINITPMYKYLAKQEYPHSAQLTAVWYWHFIEDAFTFNGFMDIWGDRNFEGKNMTVFLCEPQFWVNLNRFEGFSDKFNLSIGGEVEISYNFPVQNNKLHVIPTLAAKWTF